MTSRVTQYSSKNIVVVTSSEFGGVKNKLKFNLFSEVHVLTKQPQVALVFSDCQNNGLNETNGSQQLTPGLPSKCTLLVFNRPRLSQHLKQKKIKNDRMND